MRTPFRRIANRTLRTVILVLIAIASFVVVLILLEWAIDAVRGV